MTAAALAGAFAATALPRAWGVLTALPRPREDGRGGWYVSCPTDAHPHGDRSAGLHLSLAEDGACLVHCHAGCQTLDILRAVGLQARDLYPETPERRRAQGKAARAVEAPPDPRLVALIEEERTLWLKACRIVGREVAQAAVASIVRQRMTGRPHGQALAISGGHRSPLT